MKHFLAKNSLQIIGYGGGGGGGGQSAPPPDVSMYPAVLAPPQFTELDTISSFSYAEMVDLISDGPIEGLVNKNGKKLYDENIFEGILLDGTQVKETSIQESQDLDITFIKDELLDLLSERDPLPSWSATKILTNDEIALPDIFSNIKITAYSPEASAINFIYRINETAVNDFSGKTVYENIPDGFYHLLEKNLNSSPNIFQKPFLVHINIGQINLYLSKEKFSNLDIIDGISNPLKARIPNISDYFYYTISSDNLNSFNYSELPKSFVHNNNKIYGKRGVQKYYINDNSTFHHYVVYDLNIYLWLIADKFETGSWTYLNYSDVLDKFFNKITFYQNKSSLFNFNLIQSEFRNGSESQLPLCLFDNVEIDVEYNKQLIGPYKTCPSSQFPRSALGEGGVQRLIDFTKSIDTVNVSIDLETSDDIRWVKTWPVEYNKKGKPYLICNAVLNYTSFDKNSTNRSCQEAVPIIHYIDNENVEQVYITLNVNELSDTSHVDLVQNNGYAGFNTQAKYATAECFSYFNNAGKYIDVGGYASSKLIQNKMPAIREVGGYIGGVIINRFIDFPSLLVRDGQIAYKYDVWPITKFPNIWKYIIYPHVVANGGFDFNTIGAIALLSVSTHYLYAHDDWFQDGSKTKLKNEALEYLLDNYLFKKSSGNLSFIKWNFNGNLEKGKNVDYKEIDEDSKRGYYIDLNIGPDLITDLQTFLQKVENGKLIGSKVVNSFNVFFASIFYPEVNARSVNIGNMGSIVLRDHKAAYYKSLYNNFEQNVYLINKDIEYALDDDFYIQFFVNTPAANLDTSSLIVCNPAAMYCFPDDSETAVKMNNSVALTAGRQISAGTKLPSIIVVDVETGYELTEDQCAIDSSVCDYFAYRFNIFGLSTDQALIDLGRNCYSFVKSCQIPNKYLTESSSNILSQYKNVYYGCQCIYLFKITSINKLNNSCNTRNYISSSKWDLGLNQQDHDGGQVGSVKLYSSNTNTNSIGVYRCEYNPSDPILYEDNRWHRLYRYFPTMENYLINCECFDLASAISDDCVQDLFDLWINGTSVNNNILISQSVNPLNPNCFDCYVIEHKGQNYWTCYEMQVWNFCFDKFRQYVVTDSPSNIGNDFYFQIIRIAQTQTWDVVPDNNLFNILLKMDDYGFVNAYDPVNLDSRICYAADYYEWNYGGNLPVGATPRPFWKKIDMQRFNPTWYADNYTDIKQAFGYNQAKLFEHWINNGNTEFENRLKGPTPKWEYFFFFEGHVIRVSKTPFTCTLHEMFLNQNYEYFCKTDTELTKDFYQINPWSHEGFARFSPSKGRGINRGSNNVVDTYYFTCNETLQRSTKLTLPNAISINLGNSLAYTSRPDIEINTEWCIDQNYACSLSWHVASCVTSVLQSEGLLSKNHVFSRNNFVKNVTNYPTNRAWNTLLRYDYSKFIGYAGRTARYETRSTLLRNIYLEGPINYLKLSPEDAQVGSDTDYLFNFSRLNDSNPKWMNFWTIFNKCTSELSVIYSDLNCIWQLNLDKIIEGYRGTNFYVKCSPLNFPNNTSQIQISNLGVNYLSTPVNFTFNSLFINHDGNKYYGNDKCFFRSSKLPPSQLTTNIISFAQVNYIPLVNCIVFCVSNNFEAGRTMFSDGVVYNDQREHYYTVPGRRFEDKKNDGIAKDVIINFYGNEYIDSVACYYEGLVSTRCFYNCNVNESHIPVKSKIITQKIPNCQNILYYVEKFLFENAVIDKSQRFPQYNIAPKFKQELNNGSWIISFYRDILFSNASYRNSAFSLESSLAGSSIKIPKPKKDQYGNSIRRYVKITRRSHETLSPLIRKAISLQKVTEIIPQNFSYPFSSIIGTKIDSRSFARIPTRTFRCKLKKVLVPTNYYIYDDNERDVRYLRGNGEHQIYVGDWDGSFKFAWTDNPAWIMLDILINKRYGLGNYISSDQIDIWELYKIARWNDGVDDYGFYYGVSDGLGGVEPRHAFNAIINEKFNVFDMLNQIASVFRGHVYYMNSLVTFDCDRIKFCIGEFSNSDVKDGLFTYTNHKKDDEYTAVDVAYSDKRDNFKPKVEYVEDSDAIRQRGILKKEINAFGVTSRAQARRYGKYFLWQTAKESSNVSFVTDNKALLYKPGDLIKINDELSTSYKNYGKIKKIETILGNYWNMAITIDKKIDKPELLVQGVHPTYFGNKITVYSPIQKPNYHDFEILAGSFPRNLRVKTNSLIENQGIIQFISGYFCGYEGLIKVIPYYTTLEQEFVLTSLDSESYCGSYRMIYNLYKDVTYRSDQICDNQNYYCTLDATVSVYLKHVPDINMYCESSIYGHWLMTATSPIPSNKGLFQFRLDADEDVKLDYGNKYFFRSLSKGKLEIFDSSINDFLTVRETLDLQSSKDNIIWNKENMKSEFFIFRQADQSWYEIFEYNDFTGFINTSAFVQAQKSSASPCGGFCFVVKDVYNYGCYSIPYRELIQSDLPSINSYEIAKIETGFYQKEFETCYKTVQNQNVICHQETQNEYSKLYLKAAYDTNTFLVGSTYSLPLRNHENKTYKIMSINENYINEFSVFATEYNLKKFEEIEDNYQIDNLKNSLNQLGYSETQTYVDLDRKVGAPTINDLTFWKNGENYWLTLNWNSVINAKSYVIYLQTPSRNTPNFLTEVFAGQNDFFAGIETSNTLRAYLRIPFYKGYADRPAFMEVGTYTVSIQTKALDGSLSTFSMRSINIMNY